MAGTTSSLASRRRARAALAWGVAAFVAVQLGVTAVADGFAPAVYDPEYAARLTRLRCQRDAHPDRPLLLVLGSSRAETAFRPERLPPLLTPDGRQAVPFNFARSGAGPIYSRMTYDRLLREGYTPAWVILELAGPFLAAEWKSVYTRAAAAGDLRLLARYAPPNDVYRDYVRSRLVPVYTHRRVFLGRLAPDWQPPDPQAPEPNIDVLGGERGRVADALTAADRDDNFARNRSVFAPPLEDFRIDPGADRAVRDLVADCRARGVPVVVLLAPEAAAFRALYPPAARATLDAFTRELAAEYGVRVVDAREWLADDLFSDGQHVTPGGQAVFTDRFGAEVLAPLVGGR